jgi:hypothetical protein
MGCVVNDVLIKSLPLLLHTMAQLFDILDLLNADSFLHYSPDVVVHRVQIWTVGKPQSRLNEVRSLMSQQVHSLVSTMR